MALFILKPLVWNTNGYRGPSGDGANSGFPSERGYGHEEWNGDPRLCFTDGRGTFNVFHTEGIGSADVDNNVGQIFVFMISSRGGVQRLVGIAGNATHLAGNNATVTESRERKAERQRLVRKLGLGDLWKEAWAVPLVQKCHSYNEAKFRRHWDHDEPWIPNWIAPSEFYWWLDIPVPLDARAITGKSKLLTMFGRYEDWSIDVARRVMGSIPKGQRGKKWRAIVDAMEVAPAAPLTWDDLPPGKAPITSKLALVQARRGQGPFREQLLEAWERSCAVTGLTCPDALRASHIKRWADSNDDERLSVHNGLPLSATLDALFERGLIVFDEDGSMRVSPDLPSADLKQLRLPQPLRRAPTAAQRVFLAHHRKRHAARHPKA